MKTLLLSAAAICALACPACHSEETRNNIGNLVAEREAGSDAPTAFVAEEKNDLIDFTYGWSAEAAAVPELVARFEKDMASWKAELKSMAVTEKEVRAKFGSEFGGLMGSAVWSTAGQSGRLLSLLEERGAYTGGAHGSSGTKALLWDREARRELRFADLFTAPASRDSLLAERWCAELNKARETKRGEPVGKDGMFNDCPKLGDISIVPTDKDGDGRFEKLALIADPYVAGPWAEGDYEVELAVTDPLIAALKPDYRAGFEAQPQ